MEIVKTKLIVGLGNPGADYEKTRHNIGFEIVDDLLIYFKHELRKDKKFEALFTSFEEDFHYQVRKKSKQKLVELVPNPLSLEEHEALNEKRNPEHKKPYQEQIEKFRYLKKTIYEAKSKSVKIMLAKPLTFMNDSGRAICKIMHYHKIANENLLIIHDDVSLDTGKLKFAFDSGAGGQHGVEDTIERLGGAKNFHRLKIGVGPDPGGDRRAAYVLSRFAKSQEDILNMVKKQAMQMLLAWLVDEDFQQMEN